MTTQTTVTATVEPRAVATIDTYIAAWNQTDDTMRAELAGQALGVDLWYRDPLLEIDGIAAFVATIGFVQQQYPGHVMAPHQRRRPPPRCRRASTGRSVSRASRR